MTDRRLVQRTLLAWAVFELAAAAQVRGPDQVTVLSRWVRSAIEPVATVLVTSTHWWNTHMARFADAFRLFEHNQALEARVAVLESSNALLAAELETLRQGNVNFKLLAPFQAVPARCISRDLARGSLRLRLPSNRPDAAPKDTPVFAGGGLIGRVIRSDGHTCWVETIVNNAAAIAVTSQDGAIQALAEGRGDLTLNIRFVPQRAALIVGDRLFASGGDGVYPPGLPVADIIAVRETNDLFLEIQARPIAAIPAIRMAWLIQQDGAGEQPPATEAPP
jgi:rod shape-determining protein MreC